MQKVTGGIINQTTKLVVLGLITMGVFGGMLVAQAGDMVPYHSKTIGQMILTESGSIAAITETGIGTHLGKFTLAAEADEDGVLWFIVTATNGDNMLGAVVGGSGSTVELAVFGGTGRFVDATGHITATVTVDPNPVSLNPLTLAYTATTTGEISTVGANKK